MNFQARKKAFFFASVFYLLVACAMVVLRTLAVYHLVDPTTGYFQSSAPFYDVAQWVFAAATILFFGFTLLFGFRFAEKKEADDGVFPHIHSKTRLTTGTRLLFANDSLLRIFISAFCGFSLITFPLLSLLEGPGQAQVQNAYSDFSNLFSSYGFDAALNVLAILAGLALLLQYTPVLPLYSLRRTCLSLFPVIWGVLHLAVHFLRASRSAPGEYHNWQMLMLAIIPVFFFLQTLFTTPRRPLYRYNLFFALGIIGTAATLVFAVPTLLLSSFWYYSAYTEFSTLYSLMMLVSVALYMLVFALGSLSSLKKIEDENALKDPENAQLSHEGPTL